MKKYRECLSAVIIVCFAINGHQASYSQAVGEAEISTFHPNANFGIVEMEDTKELQVKITNEQNCIDPAKSRIGSNFGLEWHFTSNKSDIVLVEAHRPEENTEKVYGARFTGKFKKGKKGKKGKQHLDWKVSGAFSNTPYRIAVKEDPNNVHWFTGHRRDAVGIGEEGCFCIVDKDNNEMKVDSVKYSVEDTKENNNKDRKILDVKENGDFVASCLIQQPILAEYHIFVRATFSVEGKFFDLCSPITVCLPAGFHYEQKKDVTKHIAVSEKAGVWDLAAYGIYYVPEVTLSPRDVSFFSIKNLSINSDILATEREGCLNSNNIIKSRKKLMTNILTLKKQKDIPVTTRRNSGCSIVSPEYFTYNTGIPIVVKGGQIQYKMEEKRLEDYAMLFGVPIGVSSEITGSCCWNIQWHFRISNNSRQFPFPNLVTRDGIISTQSQTPETVLVDLLECSEPNSVHGKASWSKKTNNLNKRECSVTFKNK